MCRQPLDAYDDYPKSMKKYLRYNGWHFDRSLCEWAVSLMKRKNEKGDLEPIKSLGKDEVTELLKKHNVKLDNNVGYDFVYVANKCKADYLGSSVPDEKHMALHIKDTIDDVDVGDGSIMREWFAKITSNGESVDWEEYV